MRKTMISILVVALLVAACGGAAADGDATTTSQAPTSDTQAPDQSDDTSEQEPESNDQSSEQQQPAGVDGSITIDGEEFGVAQVIRCEPYDGPGSQPNDADLDLVAESTGGHYVSIVVSHSDGYTATQEIFPQQTQEGRVNLFGDGGQEQYVAFASHDVDDNWYLNFTPTLGDQEGESPLAAAPFSTGDRVVGSMPLVMDFPTEGGGELELSFDLPVPSQTVEC